MTPESVMVMGGSDAYRPDDGRSAAAGGDGERFADRILQAATQINEQTLSFIPKILAVAAGSDAYRP